MFTKTVRIALLGTPADYRTSLLPLMIKGLGYRINWVSPLRADLLIYGSFYNANASRMRWLPRPWRKGIASLADRVQETLFHRSAPPLTIFHTGENLRHDHIKADFAISHDLGIQSPAHFRLPYWMEMVDWSHEGLVGNINPRYGELLRIGNLQKPLGKHFLERVQKAVLISSHLREPRASCLSALQHAIPVDTLGSYFDSSIKDHHSSHFFKKTVLKNYAFNLCPENGLYPGYVTEKIPEAFASGCLPITYADESIICDFNPRAIINLVPYLQENQGSLLELLQSKKMLEGFSGEQLLLRTPSILGLREWAQKVLIEALQ